METLDDLNLGRTKAIYFDKMIHNIVLGRHWFEIMIICSQGGTSYSMVLYILENWTNPKPKESRQISLIYTPNKVDKCIVLYPKQGKIEVGI